MVRLLNIQRRQLCCPSREVYISIAERTTPRSKGAGPAESRVVVNDGVSQLQQMLLTSDWVIRDSRLQEGHLGYQGN